MISINELILYGQPTTYDPILSRKNIKKGIYRETKWGTLCFTDIGKKIYESSMEFDMNTKIRLIGGKRIGIMVNWDIEINNDYLKTILICRQYYVPKVRNIKCMAIKIMITGDSNSINECIKILKPKFKEPPIDFDRWDKLKGKFNVEQFEVKDYWRIIQRS